MSASVRPSVPRPRNSRPAPVSASPAAVPRERIPTLDLEESDIVATSTAPATKSAPPPPAVRKTAPALVLALDAGEDETEHGWGEAAAASTPSTRPAPVSTLPAPVSVPAPPASMARPVTTTAQLGRPTMSDPTDIIFDGMYGLTFARSPGEAAAMCAETLAKALGARAVVIHAHDLSSREVRAIGAHGDGDFDILGSAEPSDDDLVASAVICNQRPLTMRFDGELPRSAPKRLRVVGAPRTLVAAPAISWGRCLAIIEVIDADERYAARVADSAAYVAEHLARFLLARAA